MRTLFIAAAVLAIGIVANAQAPSMNEKRVGLAETAVALDATGANVLEATLKTTGLNGSPDSPVSNIRMVVRNPTSMSYAFVSGLVTFYDGSGVRCGEGIFKADALLTEEAFETDTPGIRIRCSPSTWRIIATNVLPRVLPNVTTPLSPVTGRPLTNLMISVDGQEHPIQLDKPMVLNLGDARRIIIVRQAP